MSIDQQPLKGVSMYLACPYTHEDPEVMRGRYNSATWIAATLIHKGAIVFSPLTHCREIEIKYGAPVAWEYWKDFDTFFIKNSRLLVVICMDGWRESTGVQAEIKIARENKILIAHLRLATPLDTGPISYIEIRVEDEPLPLIICPLVDPI